jgi:predicted acetyltransferase
MRLIRPGREHLPSYVDALAQGWSPTSSRPNAGAEEVESIELDPDAFLARLDGRGSSGPPLTLPDGTSAAPVPGFKRWMWDGSFCGSIQLRWLPGTVDLPPYCLGHVGYSVVPWRRNRGYATSALGQLLPEAKVTGLPWIGVTTDVDNPASQRVIEANGGSMIEQFTKPDTHGGGLALRYRIHLTG